MIFKKIRFFIGFFALLLFMFADPTLGYQSWPSQKLAFNTAQEINKVSYLTSIGLVSVELQGEGKNNPTLKALTKQCALLPGDRFQYPLYESTKEQLLNKALELGYLNAAFIQNEVQVDLINQEANIILVLETGPSFRFGPVYFPKSPVPTRYLEYYIPFKVGDPYRIESVFLLQKNLIDSDLFKNVRVEPEPLLAQKQVPLKVLLDMKARHQYTMGAGFGTDTGPRARLEWQNRSRTHIGHKIQLSAKSSQRSNQLSAQYTMPRQNPATDSLIMSAQIIEEKPADKKYSLRHETTLAAIRKKEDERTVSARYLSESFSALPTDLKSHSHFLLPTMSYLKRYQGQDLHAQRFRVYINLQGGLSQLCSSTSIIRFDARFKWIIPIQEKTYLIFRTDFGAMDARTRAKIPLSLRFFAGGDQSVRGFGYQSLGPTQIDRLGNTIVVGGRYLAVGSLELERNVYKKIGVALFADAGNAMNSLNTRLFYSAGFGLRFRTPLGALKIDIAQPLLKGKHKPRLHLNFGMDF